MRTIPYLVHGVRIASEVMLPDVAPYATDPTATRATGEYTRGDAGRAGADGPNDLEIDLLEYRSVGAEPPPGNVILDHHVHGHRQYVAAVAGDRVTFRLPGYGDFEVTGDHRRVTCVPDPGVAPGYLPIVLTGQVLPFLIALAGRTVLRAGAVEVADGAIAIVGLAGTGTSTLTAWLCATGARLVTDDVLRLDDDGTCHRGSRQIRLRNHARSFAGGGTWSDRALRRTVDGHRAIRPRTTAAVCLPLRTVLIPRSVPGSRTLAVHRMDATSGAMALAGVPRTLGWRIPAPVKALYTTVTKVAARVDVHVVDIPWGPPFDPETATRLLDLLHVEPPRASRSHARSSARVPSGQQ